jgi:aminoglycoside phosphotransferase (APT) family kinase protein
LEGCGPDTYIDPAPFAEGAHNLVLRGRNGPPGFEDFVVRYPKHPAHDAMLRKEARALALVGDYAPSSLPCDRLGSDVPFIVQKLVPGESKSFNELDDDEIGKLASTLSAVHTVVSDRFSGRSGEEPTCCDGTYEDYVWAMVHESVTVRLNRFDISPYPEATELLGSGIQVLRTMLDEEADQFRTPNRPFSLQHHDCNEGNVLWLADGTPILIDWNPTFGDPADELAYIFTDNRCNQKFVETFLQNYQPPAGSGDVAARIPMYVLKNLLDDLAWAIEMRELHAEEEWEVIYQQRLTNLSSYLLS